MKLHHFPLLALFVASMFVANAAEVEFQPGTAVEFPTKEQTAKLLVERDDFIKGLSPFDRSARLKTDKDVSEKEFLAFIGGEAAEWTEAEKIRVGGVLENIKTKIAGLKLRLPATIRMLKTSGNEEGMAAYCRGPSIVVPQNLAGMPLAKLERTLTHELFHIYSSHNPKLRSALYGVVGFMSCEAVAFPEALAKRKLTNPDAPRLDFYILIKQGENRVPMIPILYSRRETYDTKAGGEFFNYLLMRLMVLEKDGEKLRPVLNGGQPKLVDVRDAPDYMEQIGKNTGYIIHPEEILADNFVLLVYGEKEVPSPKVIEDLRKVILDASH